ncbi:MAG: acetyl-CoA carboxylase biotin carboxyl carrier protein subunit, partial [Acidimicrobiales bacterium]
MDTLALESPMQGTVVSIDVAAGDAVQRGQQLLVLESMKMEHVLVAAAAGVVTRITAAVGDTV